MPESTIDSEVVTCPKCGKPVRSAGVTNFREYVPEERVTPNVPRYWCNNGYMHDYQALKEQYPYGFVVLPDGTKPGIEPELPD